MLSAFPARPISPAWRRRDCDTSALALALCAATVPADRGSFPDLLTLEGSGVGSTVLPIRADDSRLTVTLPRSGHRSVKLTAILRLNADRLFEIAPTAGAYFET